MKGTILVTGSSGLIGRHLAKLLTATGFEVRGLDIRAAGASHGDVRNPATLARAISECEGIVHLAAISRVVWGQQDPDLCWATNVSAIEHLIQVALDQAVKPWVLVSSSREVYGQAPKLPVDELMPLNPLNVYARSKVEGERLVLAARDQGLQTAIVRLSNVYGCTHDHPDRVVPAFARAAIKGDTLRVDGSGHTFDFTHVDEVVRGIAAIINTMRAGHRSLPPIHLVTGRPTSLGQLAELSLRLSASRSRIVEAPPRSYDVENFHGDPSRAQSLLGWTAKIPLETGLLQLIEDFRAEFASQPTGDYTECSM